MNTIEVKAGDVVVSDFGVYQHWSLVSDKLCNSGLPMLISATDRNDTVKEETWNKVTKGKKTYVADVSYSHTISDVLRKARSQIGIWSYSVSEKNCEHFIKWATGLEVTSTQVKAGVGGAIAGIAIVGLVAEKPNLLKILGSALLLGVIALATSKANEKVKTVEHAPTKWF